MTHSDLAAELYRAAILLATAASDIRRKYGLSPNFSNEADKQAYSVLMSAFDTSAIDEAYKSLNKGVYD